MSSLRNLDVHEREAAKLLAKEKLIGPRPIRSDFVHVATSRYPRYVTTLIVSLCLILLVAAFVPSAIRLDHIASVVFGYAVPDALSQSAVGVAMVLLAEIGQIIFTLAVATLDKHQGEGRVLMFGAVAATAIALVGNIELSAPWAHSSLFAYLEAVLPPLLVLATSQVLKSQVLHSIEIRHQDQLLFNESLKKWEDRAQHFEQLQDWRRTYAGTLRDALRKANARQKAALDSLTHTDWSQLVQNEMRAESWYIDDMGDPEKPSASLENSSLPPKTPEQPEPPQIEPALPERLPLSMLTVSASTKLKEGVSQNADGTYTSTCPQCNRVLGVSYRTPRGASNAFSSHMKSCRGTQNDPSHP